jgi:hypothetical protein
MQENKDNKNTSITLYQNNVIDVTFTFPSSWLDLTSKELLKVCEILLIQFPTVQQQKYNILCELIKTRCSVEKIKLPYGWQKLINNEDIVLQGFDAVDFIYNTNDLTELCLTKIKIGKFVTTTVVPPKPSFEGLQVAQFEEAETHFNQFIKNPNYDDLAALAAILWIRENAVYAQIKGDKYLPYNYEYFVPKFLKLKPSFLYAIYTWYSACRKTLPDMFPDLYNPALTKSSLKSSEPDLQVFTKSIHAAAGPKNGTRDKVRCTPLLELLFDLNLEAANYLEMQETMPS